MADKAKPFPLEWPAGHARTDKPRQSKFVVDTLTIAKACDKVFTELNAWHARDVVISTNLPSKGNAPYSNVRPAPSDTGVAVYFTLKGMEYVVPVDSYTTVAENIQAAGYVISSLRTLERHGGQMIFQTVTGNLKALPAPGETAGAKWYDVLEVSPTASWETIEASYKAKAKKAHPDTGGSPEQWHILKTAFEQAKDANFPKTGQI